MVTPDSFGAWSVGADGPDVRFVEDLLDEVEEAATVDTRRVFTIGMSLGAGMSQWLRAPCPARSAPLGLVAVEISFAPRVSRCR